MGCQMGVNLSDIIERDKRKISDFSKKVIAVDAANALYQFLASIRQPDGTPLMDSSGRVTSHLTGLLTRTANLAASGIKLVYVFDGKPHELKHETLAERREIKMKAQTEWEMALEAGDIELAKSKAQQTSRLTNEMIEEAKILLERLGVPYVVAPGEGEGQASYMAKQGDVWAAASQDFDAVLFGCPNLVRNLTLSGRRKLPGKNVYVDIEPESVDLAGALSKLGVTQRQIVDVGILCGTDFNNGVKGVGPKTALKLIKEYGTLEKIIAAKGYEIKNYEAVQKIFLEPSVTDDYKQKLVWGKPDLDSIKDFLCAQREFSIERVEGAVKKFEVAKDAGAQKSLDAWFG